MQCQYDDENRSSHLPDLYQLTVVTVRAYQKGNIDRVVTYGKNDLKIIIRIRNKSVANTWRPGV
jgi:ribosomal 30S subunit maturation factor RimM